MLFRSLVGPWGGAGAEAGERASTAPLLLLLLLLPGLSSGSASTSAFLLRQDDDRVRWRKGQRERDEERREGT